MIQTDGDLARVAQLLARSSAGWYINAARSAGINGRCLMTSLSRKCLLYSSLVWSNVARLNMFRSILIRFKQN